MANNVRSACKRSDDRSIFNPNALLTKRLAIAVHVLGLVAGRGVTDSALSFDSFIAFFRGLVFTSAKVVFNARSAVCYIIHFISSIYLYETVEYFILLFKSHLNLDSRTPLMHVYHSPKLFPDGFYEIPQTDSLSPLF